MEIGLIYNFNQVQNFGMVGQNTNSCFDLFKLTNQVSRPFNENKIGYLNEICAKLANLPFLFEVGLEIKDDMTAPSTSYRNVAEANLIHHSLQAIPIYHEVLCLKSQEKNMLYKSEAALRSTEIQNYFGDFKSNEINNSYPKSQEWNNKWMIGNQIRALSRSQSTVQSFSMNASHSDNSLVLTEKHMNNELDSSRNRFSSEIMENNEFPSTRILGFPQNYVNEGMPISLPQGYIQIEPNNSCSRRTKVVTNCEHVDRKHYAKGLCSSCYHKGGRTKLAYNCPHYDRVMYAKGRCQECYSVLKRQRKQMKKQLNNELRSLHGMYQINGYN